MTRLALRFALAPALALALTACGADEAPPAEMASGDSVATVDTASAPPVAARMEGGIQTADVSVDGTAFEPAAIRLRPGVPARLVLTRTEAATCADSVHAPGLGVPMTALPVGEPVAVEFKPDEAGTYTFACGMDMVSARIVVQS
jgi:plastocyanin domain-containing protein